MIEITNGIDYVFIKNIEDIYKIELFEDYYYKARDIKDNEYKIKVYAFNSNTDEYSYTISFKDFSKAEKEYKKIIKVIRGENNE